MTYLVTFHTEQPLGIAAVNRTNVSHDQNFTTAQAETQLHLLDHLSVSNRNDILQRCLIIKMCSATRGVFKMDFLTYNINS